MVIEECNLLELKLIDKTRVKITKSIFPITALFFKKYGKPVQPTYDSISSLNSTDLDNFIESGGIYKFNHKGEQGWDEYVFEPEKFYLDDTNTRTSN